MQTKLLKKVRKRYSIIYIENYNRSDSKEWKSLCDEITLPFYYLIDNDSPFGYRNGAHKSYDDAYSRLKRWIDLDYSCYSTHKTKKETKVWWINKN